MRLFTIPVQPDHPLYESWEKWERGNAVAHAIDDETFDHRQRFIESHLDIVVERTVVPREFAARAQLIEVSPERLDEVSLRLGEVIYNFRSALDYLFYQLVIRKHGDPPPDEHRLQFPTLSSGNSLGRDYRKWLTDEAYAFVDACQPFHGSHNHSLADLATLSNYDKHRRPLAVMDQGVWVRAEVTIRKPGGDAVCAPVVFGGAVKNGQELGRFRLETPGPFNNYEVNSKLEADMMVRLRDRLDGAPLLQTLGGIRERVRDVIREAGEMFFGESSIRGADSTIRP